MTFNRSPRRQTPSAYRVVAKEARAEIFLYGLIGMDWFGEGVTAKTFAEDLRKLGKVEQIDLRINSDGGVVDDARAIYSLLVEHEAAIAVHIDGLAASAASFIAMAGNDIEIAEGGFMMIHNARGFVVGEAEDMRRYAGVLDSYTAAIRDTYVARTGQDSKTIRKWMDDETWFTGKEAVANGFADRIVQNLTVAASISDPSRFRNLPAALRPNRCKAAAILCRMKSRP